MTRAVRGLVLPLALSLIGIAECAPALFTGRTYLRNDYGAEAIPAFDSLRGHLPFWGAPSWNGTIFGGAPAEVLPTLSRYPGNLFAYVLPGSSSVLLFVALHLALAACTAFAFVRRVGGTSRAGAAIGGSIYAYGGALWLQGEHVALLAVAAWLPAVLLGVFETITSVGPEGRRRAAAFLAGSLAMALSVGTGLQLLYYGALASLAVIGDASACAALGGTGRWRSLLRATPWLFGALLVALLASLPALIPELEVIRGAARGRLDLGMSAGFALHPPALARLFAPDLLRGPAWDWNGYVERWCYFGVLSLPLAALGARDPRGRFFLSMAVLGLLLALGIWGGLHLLLYAFLPGYGYLRAPGRWTILVGLSLAALAGRGLDALLHDPKAVRFARLTGGAAGVMAAAGLAASFLPALKGEGSASLRLFAAHAALAAGYLALSQGSASRARLVEGRGDLLGGRRIRIFGEAAALALLLVDVGALPLRVHLEEDRAGLRPPPALADAAARLQGKSRLFHDDTVGTMAMNGGELWSYRNMRGYSQLVPAAWSRLLDLGAPSQGARYSGLPAAEDPRLFRLAGVTAWVGQSDSRPPPGFVPGPFRAVDGLAEWLSPDPPLDGIVVATVQPDEFGLLEEPPLAVGTVERRTDRIEVSLDTAESGLLVLAESFHPRWSAQLDGRPAPVEPAGPVWMAVRVGQGHHLLRLSARAAAPWWTWLGSLCGVVLVSAGRRRLRLPRG